ALGFATYHQALYWENDLALFTRGCAVAPRNLLAKLNLSAELTRDHRFEGAFMVAQQAIDLNPNSPLALSAGAQAAYYLGNYTTSENYYARALAFGPPRVDQLYYLGMSRIEMGRFREGLEPLEKGLTLWRSEERRVGKESGFRGASGESSRQGVATCGSSARG